jgi:release factor glutamine methyltransferase
VTATPLPTPVSDVIARLRAAGCVFAEDEARLLLDTARTPAELAGMVERRVAGLPLEHVLGWAEFAGRRVAVDPGVFVPRRRTELLVREAAARARPGAVVVDLCCGSGAVGVAVAAAVPGIELHAADVDPAAVRCARRNVTAFGGQVHEGDLDAPLPAALRGRVDVLVANAPYVPTGAVGLMPPEARLPEPRVALDGGADGLDVQRRACARPRTRPRRSRPRASLRKWCTRRSWTRRWSSVGADRPACRRRPRSSGAGRPRTPFWPTHPSQLALPPAGDA